MTTIDLFIYSTETQQSAKLDDTRWRRVWTAAITYKRVREVGHYFPRDATHAHWCLDSRNILSGGYGRPDFWWLPQIPQQWEWQSGTGGNGNECFFLQIPISVLLNNFRIFQLLWSLHNCRKRQYHYFAFCFCTAICLSDFVVNWLHHDF